MLHIKVGMGLGIEIGFVVNLLDPSFSLNKDENGQTNLHSLVESINMIFPIMPCNLTFIIFVLLVAPFCAH